VAGCLEQRSSPEDAGDAEQSSSTTPTDSAALTFYVSADEGNDDWSGRRPAPNAAESDGPFATIRRARDAIRERKSSAGGLPGPVTVAIRGGTYRIEEPLVFTPEDSGTAEAPVTYAAYEDETPVVSGGREIGPWKTGDGDVWTIDLPSVVDGEWFFRQLWVGGERRQRARIPNEGTFRFKGLVDWKDPSSPINREAFVYEEGQIDPDWHDLQDVEVLKFFGWDEARRPIESVDPENQVCRLAEPVSTNAGRPIDWFGKRYVVENVREGLDQPGEWYLDEETGTLEYLPTAEASADVSTVAPVADHLLRFEGEPGERRVRHLRFDGLTFAHSRALVGDGYAERQSDVFAPAAIEGDGVRDVRFVDSELRSVGTYGFDFAADCRGVAIEGCHVHDVGGGGMRFGERNEPEDAARRTERNRIADNRIHDTGHVYVAGAGIWIGFSGHNTVVHNELHHVKNNAISLGWTWRDRLTASRNHTVAYNHVHDLGHGRIGGASGVYFLARQPGTEVHHNLIHGLTRDTDDSAEGRITHPGFGFQLDQGASQLTIHHNVVFDVYDATYKQMGTAQTLRNNVLAYAEAGHELLRRDDEGAVYLQQNVICSRDAELYGDTWAKQNSHVDYNCYWIEDETDPVFAGRTLEEWREMGRDEHSILAEPDFLPLDPSDRVFDPGQAGYTIGFDPIDLREVGPRDDPGPN
jgi:hypothetical protein